MTKNPRLTPTHITARRNPFPSFTSPRFLAVVVDGEFVFLGIHGRAAGKGSATNPDAATVPKFLMNLRPSFRQNR